MAPASRHCSAPSSARSPYQRRRCASTARRSAGARKSPSSAAGSPGCRKAADCAQASPWRRIYYWPRAMAGAGRGPWCDCIASFPRSRLSSRARRPRCRADSNSLWRWVGRWSAIRPICFATKSRLACRRSLSMPSTACWRPSSATASPLSSSSRMCAARLRVRLAITACRRGAWCSKANPARPITRRSRQPISEFDVLIFAETFLNGLMLGALYALFGLGLSLSLGVMRMINIAHGDLIVVGAYLTSVATGLFGVDPIPSVLVVGPAMFALGWLMQRLLLNRVVGRGPLAPLLLTFGLSIVLQNLLQEIFTADTRSLRAGDLAQLGVNISGVSIGVLPLLSMFASITLLGTTHWLIGHTHFGRQARAVSDDPETARLVGVNDRRFFALVTGFIFATIGIAAVLYAIRTPFSPTAGPERLLYSFESVVLGGLGNIWGTLVGGIVIGVAQLFGAKISSGLWPFFGHLILLIVLLARPQGLFGRAAS